MFGRNGNFSSFLVLEAVYPLHVRSEVCLASIHVQSKVCIAPFYVRSKDCKFAPPLKRSHADFAPHMKQRHSFRDQQKAEIAISANLKNFFCQTPYILRCYIIYVTTFENKQQKLFEEEYI